MKPSKDNKDGALAAAIKLRLEEDERAARARNLPQQPSPFDDAYEKYCEDKYDFEKENYGCDP
jgi:hypothetical protein